VIFEIHAMIDLSDYTPSCYILQLVSNNSFHNKLFTIKKLTKIKYRMTNKKYIPTLLVISSAIFFLLNSCAPENNDFYTQEADLKYKSTFEFNVSDPIVVGKSMSITGTAPGADFVQAKVDVWEIGSSQVENGEFEINYSFNSPGTDRMLTLTAYNGNDIVAETVKYIDVYADDPSLTITWSNPVYKNTPVAFTGVAKNAETVAVYVDTWPIGTATVNNNQFTFNYSFSSAGAHRNMIVKARDINKQVVSEISKPITILKESSGSFQVPDLVLMYHEITPEPVYSSDVSVSNFEEQMQWLKANGYNTVTTADLLSGNLPNNSVVITFDDGYIGNFIYAKPILESLNMKADFFVHTAYVGAPGSHDHMTWEQLEELSSSALFEVFSHTVNHAHLTTLTSTDLNHELFSSKRAIENQLNKNCSFIAYPFGDYNAEVIQKVIDNGYQIAYAVEDKGAFYFPRQYSIPRVGIGKNIYTINQFIQRITN
jgi:peptidoglycan/xylan/chitin deacetylase (PgdA/CDA1 family)